jgi:hypothetical protein
LCKGRQVVTFCSADVVIAYPTTPPAGPERIALDPLNEFIGVSPPSDCMKATLTPSKSSTKPEAKLSRYFLMHGVR